MSLDLTNNRKDLEKAAVILARGGIGVVPTDTIYGLVGLALNQQAVETIYHLKKRSEHKPFIILISKISDLALFNISLDQTTSQFLAKIWPGKISIILPCPSSKFSYLHRQTKSLAFRFPNYPPVLTILSRTGPLVAPSANFEGDPPAQDITQAKRYFGDQVDFYLDVGKLDSSVSTLIKIDGKNLRILRQGAYGLKDMTI